MQTDSHPFQLLIDGELIAGRGDLAVEDPATGEVFAHAPRCTPPQLDAAICAARRALPAWRDMGIERRRVLVQAMAERLAPHVDTLAPLLTREQGKPLALARREFDSTLRFMRGLAKLDLPETVAEDTPVRRVVTRWDPIGVVAALSPWNFPVLLSWWKVVPALLAGNTVVLKPSPLTPLTVLRCTELLADLLPPGVLNVVSGGDDLGPLLTSHPGIDKVSFTGSTETGRRVMASAAPTLKRLTLELGGNDAAIVLPDADVAAAVPQLFWSAFANSGQVCVATKRLYVHKDRYDELAQAMVAFARTVKMGPGLAADTQLGPLQNRKQYERVRALMDESRAAGLRVLWQGEAPTDCGYFVPVTLYDNPPETSRLVAEEPFAPLLPLLRYDSVDEAVERANASPYGLAGSVWSRDLAQAEAVAARLDTGNVFINEPYYLTPDAPFGGHKQSGLGVENGREGLLAYAQARTVVMRRG
jgi:acyl-CoA reductase-like NAD-dependent aldehyde dehydrogenase